VQQVSPLRMFFSFDLNMRDADRIGQAGRAWQLALNSEWPACLAGWLVDRPGAHPWWHNYIVAVVHLRDVPGVGAAKKQYPEAAYEFQIVTVNPEECPVPDPDAGHWPFLIPPDVIHQFHGVKDEDAVRICELAVSAIADGLLSPDSDFRSAWKASLETTVRHFVDGRHALH
jgi:hypothetical protein